MAFTELAYERKGRTGWITLDRPARRNTLSPTMIRELLDVLDLVSLDDDLRCLVITGAGAAFCTGADVAYYRRTMELDGGIERLVDELVEPFMEFTVRVRTLPYPVIAAINGACDAAGLRIARSCDIVVTEPAPPRTGWQARRSTLVNRVERLTGAISTHPLACLRALKATTN
jgi:enoyl-CoA hydratase/carnithine racemase